VKALLQRVSRAEVTVSGGSVGQVGRGLLIFLGVGRDDTEKEADWLAEKILGLRIFPDPAGLMNVPVTDTGGSILLISQFTLLGDCRKGKRPSFSQAAEPVKAEALYLYLGRKLAEKIPVAWGQFGAMMEVSLINDGPVTFLVEKTPEIKTASA
jgi:D-tyrosyl-tRNA(Tyr) deacylase